MFELDLDRVRENVAKATTTDLLERVTVYRDGMEPAALDVIETELRLRNVSYQQQEAFGAAVERATVRGSNGSPRCCCRCSRAAVAEQWGWHYLWKILPCFPGRFAYCDEHRPDKPRKALPLPPAPGLEYQGLPPAPDATTPQPTRPPGGDNKDSSSCVRPPPS